MCFSVHKLANFSSNPDKAYFEGLVHLLRYIRDNRNLSLIYYAKIEDSHLSDLLRQYRIHHENQLMVFSDSIWKGYQDNVRSIGSYIFFNQGGPIYHCTHVPGPVTQYGTESKYNSTCTAVMSLAHFRMTNNGLIKKYLDVVL